MRHHWVLAVCTADDQAHFDQFYTSVVLVVVDLVNSSEDLAVVLDITSVLLEVYHQVGTHKQEGVVPNHAVQSSHIDF